MLSGRVLYRSYRLTTTLIPTTIGTRTMATETADSLNASITHATVALNDLRLQNADASSIDAAKKRLGELKKSMAAIASAGGSKDAGKKKERLLLKTAKVCPGVHGRSYSSEGVLK